MISGHGYAGEAYGHEAVAYAPVAVAPVAQYSGHEDTHVDYHVSSMSYTLSMCTRVYKTYLTKF